MEGTPNAAEDRFRDAIRSRALRRMQPRPEPRGPRIGALAVAVLLHLGAGLCLYLLMRPPPAMDPDRIEVRLLDAAPSEPDLPEPPPPIRAAPKSEARVQAPVRPSNPAASSPPAERVPQVPNAIALFNGDGSVRLPPPLPAKPESHRDALERGRALMARGLDCTTHAPDQDAHRENAGEEVARKYLSWIGLYNPAAAQLRAEQEEQRQARCRMWLREAEP